MRAFKNVMPAKAPYAQSRCAIACHNKMKPITQNRIAAFL